MARQGYSYTTADGARVVYQTEGEDLKDVPRDGKTIGEVVVRGNLVMKEVNVSQPAFVIRLFDNLFGSCSISPTRRLPRKLSKADTSIVAIWPSCTPTGPWASKTGARISLFPEERCVTYPARFPFPDPRI